MSVSMGGLFGEPGEGGFFTGDPEGYVQEGPGNRSLSSKGAQLGNLACAHLPGTSRDLLLECVAADNEAANLQLKWV